MIKLRVWSVDVEVEFSYRPPVKYADNPDDAAGYLDSNIVGMYDTLTATNLTTNEIRHMCASRVFMAALHSKVEQWIAEQYERSLEDSDYGAQAVDRLQ